MKQLELKTRLDSIEGTLIKQMERMEEIVSVVTKLWSKMETLNDRTKRQTKQIRELKFKIKEMSQ